MHIYIILALLFALIVAVFAVQNSMLVDLNFLGWHFEDISLVLVILGSVMLGSFIVLLFTLSRQVRSAMRIRELNNKNQKLTEEVKQLQVKIDDSAPVESENNNKNNDKNNDG